ncbi:MAG: cobyric acid synthase CobQ, partial [Candidatus Tectimicrobiota bacterium]
VLGTAIHGCFDAAAFRRHLLDTLRAERGWPPLGQASFVSPKDAYDRLADLVETHLDWPAICQLVEEGAPTT